MTARAVDYDLDLTPISSFCLEARGYAGLLLGYGGYDERQIRAGIRRLENVLDSI